MVPITSRGVVGREGVGTTFPHLFHFLLQNKFEAVSKWLFFGCVPTPFLLALHPDHKGTRITQRSLVIAQSGMGDYDYLPHARLQLRLGYE